MPEDTIDHMETENAQSEGRTREMVDEDKEIDERILSTEDVLSTDKEGVSTDFEKVSTDKPIVSTDGSKVSIDRHIEGDEEQIVGTEENIEGTEEHIEGTEEQVESTDGLESLPLKITSSTLKPLPKIDLKATGRRRMKRADELQVNLMVFSSWRRSLSSLKVDEDVGLGKMQEEWEAEEERNRMLKNNAANGRFIEILSDEDFISIGSAEDERLIKKMNEKRVDSSKDEMIKEQSKEEVKKESKEEVQEESKEEEKKKYPLRRKYDADAEIEVRGLKSGVVMASGVD
ncbi:hypothetical protein Tco_1229289 [Tanacetum coccineum]